MDTISQGLFIRAIGFNRLTIASANDDAGNQPGFRRTVNGFCRARTHRLREPKVIYDHEQM
jgi:hypothetical protein